MSAEIGATGDVSVDAAEAEWFFLRSDPRGKRRDPAWAEFFHSAASIEDNCVALVRESLQNSLDASRDAAEPVTVRFALAGPASAVPNERADQYFGRLTDHVRASDLGGPDPESDCQFLVVEDFGTTGLLGDPASAKEPDPDEKNHFYYFFRHEGKSGKQHAQRGRWGIGRFVFPMSSQLYSIVALTIRDDSIGDSPEPLLMGNSVLKVHDLDDQTYEPDGYWGEVTDASTPIQPFRDSKVIEAFSRDFRLSRSDESGLSVVVPYIEAGWTTGKLVNAIVRDYFVPIANGRLSVVVEDLDADSRTAISRDTLHEIVKALDAVRSTSLLHDIQLVEWAENEPTIEAASTYDGGSRPQWDVNLLLEDSALELARSRYAEHGRVVVKVPVSVRRTDEEPRESFIKVVIADSPEERRAALFVRSGVIVSEAGRGSISDARAIVLIDDEPASQMLGDAEGPAHVNWSDQTKAFKQRYTHGSTWLSIVRSSPIEILKRLRGLEGRQDDLIAAEYFPLPDPGPREKTKGKPSPGRPTPPRGKGRMQLIFESPEPGQIEARLNRKAIQNHATQVVLTCAYDAVGTHALRAWEPDDFRLVIGSPTQPSDVGIEVEGALGSVTDNRLDAEITDAEQFKVTLSGFDPKRDLVFESEVIQ